MWIRYCYSSYIDLIRAIQFTSFNRKERVYYRKTAAKFPKHKSDKTTLAMFHKATLNPETCFSCLGFHCPRGESIGITV